MKFTKILILLSVLFLTSCSSDKKTAELSFGTMQCLMCSMKVEEAVAELNGIKNVEVDLKAQSGKVIYKASIINLSDIENAITSIGYDVNGKKADKNAYDELELCCRIPTTN